MGGWANLQPQSLGEQTELSRLNTKTFILFLPVGLSLLSSESPAARLVWPNRFHLRDCSLDFYSTFLFSEFHCFYSLPSETELNHPFSWVLFLPSQICSMMFSFRYHLARSTYLVPLIFLHKSIPSVPCLMCCSFHILNFFSSSPNAVQFICVSLLMRCLGWNVFLQVPSHLWGWDEQPPSLAILPLCSWDTKDHHVRNATFWHRPDWNRSFQHACLHQVPSNTITMQGASSYQLPTFHSAVPTGARLSGKCLQTLFHFLPLFLMDLVRVWQHVQWTGHRIVLQFFFTGCVNDGWEDRLEESCICCSKDQKSQRLK